MRFGVTIPNFGPFFHPRTLGGLAAEAEAAGWDGVFLWDHVLFAELPTVDPWVALSAIALATERIRLGPLVTALPRRRPVKLARETVSLDHLSDGRLILGVGNGQLPWELEGLGEEADLDKRAAMLDEGLEVLTGLWSGRPFSHRGEHYRVHASVPGAAEPAAFLPPPVQAPRIPIWVAGTWPNRRPFRRAARWDGVVPIKATEALPEMLTPDELRAVVAYVGGLRSGDAPFDFVISGPTSGTDRGRDAALVGEYRDAGATWWIESVDPWRYGWAWQGPWPVEEMNRRIRLGPPVL